MGEKPLICATIGHDYQKYFKWLAKKWIIHGKTSKIIADEFTAGRIHNHRPFR
jgi:hypothetical protein